MTLNCPACGAEVRFKSRSSIFGVCSFCGSTLVRHDLNVENIGKMAELPQDMSPLQIGTSGRYEGKNFEIVGRQKIVWDQGQWNEWYVLFDDGRDGWLADAQGFYMVSFQLPDSRLIPPREKIRVSESIKLGDGLYTVDDIREVTCAGSQGELPVKSAQGRKSTSVDLKGPGQSFGSIDFSPEGDRLFLGKYVEFDDLKFMNLREIDGW